MKSKKREIENPLTEITELITHEDGTSTLICQGDFGNKTNDEIFENEILNQDQYYSNYGNFRKVSANQIIITVVYEITQKSSAVANFFLRPNQI